jgi:inner membrane protein
LHHRGHIGLTATLYAPFSAVLATTDPLLALPAGLFTVACGFAPDVDSYITDRFLEHRGVTHTVGFAVLVGVVGAWMFSHSPIDNPALGFVLGVVGAGSHLVADWLNPMGIAPWYPMLDRRLSLEFCDAGDPTVNRLLLALGGLSTLVAIGATLLAR